MTNFLFVTGGVSSSLGKGVTTAGLAFLLKGEGYSVNILKIDPYLNVDPGTMNPYQHGEVYVLADGTETDLDLGHYERIGQLELSGRSSLTMGKVMLEVIQQERDGKYLGNTVQMVPHVSDKIIEHVKDAGKDFDFCLVEIGGTVGDIEAMIVLEAVRQMCLKHPRHCRVLHLALVPYLEAAGEAKTKPVQHSVEKLRQIGLQPQYLLCRTHLPEHFDQNMRDKISLMCGLSQESVYHLPDCESVYHVPLQPAMITLSKEILKGWGCWPAVNQEESAILQEARNLLGVPLARKDRPVIIGLVGKYTDHKDAYKSIEEAICHGALALGINVEVRKFQSRYVLLDKLHLQLAPCAGIIVPGGFGNAGADGKMQTVCFALEKRIPFLGICLGMQMAIIQLARQAGLSQATSREFDPQASCPVIDFCPGQEDKINTGSSMRLGNHLMHIVPGSLLHTLYESNQAMERHRHRYEVNLQYREALERGGLLFSGVSPDGKLMEVCELPETKHPFFMSCQFHPEYRSRLLDPHPLFKGFLQAAMKMA